MLKCYHLNFSNCNILSTYLCFSCSKLVVILLVAALSNFFIMCYSLEGYGLGRQKERFVHTWNCLTPQHCVSLPRLAILTFCIVISFCLKLYFSDEFVVDVFYCIVQYMYWYDWRFLLSLLCFIDIWKVILNIKTET